jgi:asparagine synthase (glutamine-hydrolysing)
MGQIAGIFYFDQRPLSANNRAEVYRGLEMLSSDEVNLSEAPGLIMADRRQPSQSRRSIPPYNPAAAHCSWDGRIDNRKQLVDSGYGNADASDAEFALALFSSGGAAALHDLVGDWSLALGATDARAVLLARDFAGVRPLYYHHTPERLIWSSSLDLIRRWAGANDLDAGYLAQYLATGSAAGLTPFRAIKPVPPGRALRFSKIGVEVTQFWQLPADRTLRCQDDREYGERCRALLEEAVRARLSMPGAACAELSGGLDSSSVVCVADRAIVARSVPVSRLITLSYRDSGSHDREFMREVRAVCSADSVEFDLEATSAAAIGSVGSGQPLLWVPRFAEVSRWMRSVGSSVLLSGRLGDLVMGNWFDGSEQVGQRLYDWRISDAIRMSFAWSQILNQPAPAILWNAVRQPARAIHPAGLEFLTSTVRKRILDQRENPEDDPYRHAPPGRRSRSRALHEALRSCTLECPEPFLRLSYTHPLAHRPLVEFMMSIPSDTVYRPNEPRRLMRRALAGLLPAPVLTRRSKSSYQAAFRRALVPLAQEMLRRPAAIRLVERSLADRQRIEARLSRYVAGLECGETHLRSAILLEFWLRNLEAQPLAAQSPLPPATAPAPPLPERQTQRHSAATA